MTFKMNYRMHYNTGDNDFGKERCVLDGRGLKDKWRRYTIAEFRKFGSERRIKFKRRREPRRLD